MKSNPCRLPQNAEHLADVFAQVDQCAAYNSLTRKRWLQLRLLAEELTGMLPSLLKWSEGVFWLENTDDRYELHVSLKTSIASVEQHNQLLALSLSGKNAAATGIMGKIRCAVEEAMLSNHSGRRDSGHAESEWTLEAYRSQAQSERESRGELEKSIIANLADDVIVAIKGENVTITVIKTFWTV